MRRCFVDYFLIILPIEGYYVVTRIYVVTYTGDYKRGLDW
jgi:hypothetical protein